MKTKTFTLITAFIAAAALLAADGTWTAPGGGDWSGAANWQNNTPAQGPGATAFFTSGSGTVNNDVTDLALLGLVLDGAGFTFTGNPLALDADGFIRVLGGSHAVDLPLTLSGDTAVTAALNEGLTLSGALSGAGGLTLNGGRVTLANAANAYTGQTVLQTGLLEVASIGALGGGTAPLTLGKGTFRYAGNDGSGDLTQGYTVLNGGGNAVTVLDVRTNLTVSGKVDAPSVGGGRVIKAGPGTLTYACPGYQTLNRGGSGVTADTNLVVDPVNGGAGIQGYQDFTLAEGGIVFNTPGQTNRFTGHTVIGVRYPAAAHMEVHNGVLQAPDTWFSISRGNGDAGTPYSSSLTVTGGRVELRGIIMGYGAKMSGFKSYPRLIQSGGVMTASGDSYVPESGGAVGTLIFSGGTFTSDGTGQGFDLNRGGTAGTSMDVTGNAVVSLAKLRVNTGATLSVTNGGTLALRSTTAANNGTVLFDNATLTTYAPADQPSEWFHGTPKLYVGAGGLTTDVPAGQYAFLATPPAEYPSDPGGRLAKTGLGTLALQNTKLPVDVQQGRLRLMGGHLSSNETARSITLAQGTELELAAPHAAETHTAFFWEGEPALDLTVTDLTSHPDLWQLNGTAVRRADGRLQLTPMTANTVGSAFMARRFSMTNAWQMGFAVAAVGGRGSGAQGDGVALVIQNDARGKSAVSTNVTGYGYAGAAVPVTNSFAVALDVTNRRLRFATNGVFTADHDISFSAAGIGADIDQTRVQVSYDGIGTVACRLQRKGLPSIEYVQAVDLTSLTGGTHAWIGFTAGNTANRFEQHMVSEVSFATGTPEKAYAQYGGSLDLAAGQTSRARINPAPAQNGFGMAALTYSDNSVLDISQATKPEPPEPLKPPDIADQAMWTLNGKAFWDASGSLSVSSNAQYSSGSAYCTRPYTVTNSWTARFRYDMGLRSTPPADGFALTLQALGPTNPYNIYNTSIVPAVSVGWRYYEGDRRTTGLRIVTNGVTSISSYDIAPIDLVQNGPAEMTVAYDATDHTLTVTTVQSTGTNVTVYANVNIGALLGGPRAYIGFNAYTGGSYAQNLISGFTFDSEGLLSADEEEGTSWRRGYLAFDAVSGSGTLVKRGNAALGIHDGPANAFSNATVRLEQGGLVLRKALYEPVTLGDAFRLSPNASWTPGGILQTMWINPNTAGAGTTANRYPVTQAWTARFTFFVGARNGAADAFSFFMHNDPRGPAALGAHFASAGYAGTGSIQKSLAVRWNFYEDNNMSNTVEIGKNGAFVASTRRSNLPIRITTTNLATDMELRHDPVAKTLALTMIQDTNIVATVFTDIDIPALVGDSLAYIGFGSGCGGQQCETRVKDFCFSFDAPQITQPVSACLGTAVVPAGATAAVTLDTVVPDAAFTIASVQAGDGATLRAESLNANNGSLNIAQTEIDGTVAFDAGRGGSALSLGGVTGAGTLVKQGAGTLTLADTAAYTGDTVLAEGTLALDAPRLPDTTDLHVTSGATLHLAFIGKQYIHALYIDSAPQSGGRYTAANAPWITGPGALVVTYPPLGSLIMLK
jgi:autotransporter-associated beta strand protein